jgi:hypothetical protein
MEAVRALMIPDWRVRLEFKLQDLWIGAYWHKSFATVPGPFWEFDLWICLVPCCPIHISRARLP